MPNLPSHPSTAVAAAYSAVSSITATCTRDVFASSSSTGASNAANAANVLASLLRSVHLNLQLNLNLITSTLGQSFSTGVGNLTTGHLPSLQCLHASLGAASHALKTAATTLKGLTSSGCQGAMGKINFILSTTPSTTSIGETWSRGIDAFRAWLTEPRDENHLLNLIWISLLVIEALMVVGVVLQAVWMSGRARRERAHGGHWTHYRTPSFDGRWSPIDTRFEKVDFESIDRALESARWPVESDRWVDDGEMGKGRYRFSGQPSP